MPQRFNTSKLVKAYRALDFDAVDEVLANGQHLQTSIDGFTPLMYASAQSNSEKLVPYLCSQFRFTREQINQRSTKYLGNQKRRFYMRYLYGNSPSFENIKHDLFKQHDEGGYVGGHTALSIAMMFGSHDTVIYLLSRGANLKSRTNPPNNLSTTKILKLREQVDPSCTETKALFKTLTKELPKDAQGFIKLMITPPDISEDAPPQAPKDKVPALTSSTATSKVPLKASETTLPSTSSTSTTSIKKLTVEATKNTSTSTSTSKSTAEVSQKTNGSNRANVTTTTSLVTTTSATTTVPASNSAELNQAIDEWEFNSHNFDAVVQPRDSNELCIDIPIPATVEWTVEIASKGILLNAQLQPKVGHAILLRDKGEKIKGTQSGSWKLPVAGKLMLTLDNRYSKLRSKQVKVTLSFKSEQGATKVSMKSGSLKELANGKQAGKISIPSVYLKDSVKEEKTVDDIKQKKKDPGNVAKQTREDTKVNPDVAKSSPATTTDSTALAPTSPSHLSDQKESSRPKSSSRSILSPSSAESRRCSALSVVEGDTDVFLPTRRRSAIPANPVSLSKLNQSLASIWDRFTRELPPRLTKLELLVPRTCQQCGALNKRPLDCKGCGLYGCTCCLSKYSPVPPRGIDEPEKVCDKCFDSLFVMLELNARQCYSCTKAFGMFTRKIYCTHCRRAVCKKCIAPQPILLSHMGLKHSSTVCTSCSDGIQKMGGDVWLTQILLETKQIEEIQDTIEELPDGWIRVLEDEMHYYFNPSTQESQWEKPGTEETEELVRLPTPHGGFITVASPKNGSDPRSRKAPNSGPRSHSRASSVLVEEVFSANGIRGSAEVVQEDEETEQTVYAI